MKTVSAREEKIMKNICEAVNKMSDFEKGYLLGMVSAWLPTRMRKDARV